MQRFEADVCFECPNCGASARSSAEVPEPDWAIAENTADLSSEGETLLSCDKCGASFEAHVSNVAGSCDIQLIDHPDTSVKADQAFFSTSAADDWVDRIGSDDALHVFTESIAHSLDILREHGSPNGFDLINRMVFSHLISTWEAYLSDTIKSVIANDQSAVGRLVSAERSLSDKKYTLPQIEQNLTLVLVNVKEFLDSFVFHNLPKVIVLYKITAKIDIKPSDDVYGFLLSAIKHRHDCVHRNGYDINKNRVEVFTPIYIRETAHVLSEMVSDIEFLLSRGDQPW